MAGRCPLPPGRSGGSLEAVVACPLALIGSLRHLQAMQEVPVTYVVPSSEQDSPEGSDEDEELQRALRLSLAEQQEQQSRSPPSAGGAGAGLQQAPTPTGSAWAALPPAEHGGSWASLGAASAPPLPDDQADWAEGFWRQQPGWQDGSDSEQQRPDAAAAAADAAADAAARYDEQLATDEALAQSLHEQELRQLSGEDRGAGSGWGWLGVVYSAWFVQAGGYWRPVVGYALPGTASARDLYPCLHTVTVCRHVKPPIMPQSGCGGCRPCWLRRRWCGA